MKPAWSDVKLRVSWGDVPDPSSILLLPSGRRYQVLRVRGRTMHCIVLPPGAEADGPVLTWQWAPRSRKARR